MPVPRVRVVVLNFNGGEHVLRCLDHLLATEWPPDSLEIVVVDNASTDGSDAEVESRFSEVQLLRSPANAGFPANNLALADLEGVDLVALVNNDAFVDPGWLRPLVDALEADESLGAVCPKILFEPGFVEVEIRAPAFVPGGGDPRELGVRVSGVQVDGLDVWRQAQFVEGFWGLEHGPAPEEVFQWTAERAVLRVPVDASKPASGTVALRLAGPEGSLVTLSCGGSSSEATLGAAASWVEVPLSGQPYDVINNVGSLLVRGGYGADRGFLQRDEGQFDEAAEVFAWCGAGVLLGARYLRSVGLFDERFFMYYEDTDLSWRARAAGWRHRTVPESVIRHLHAATSVEGSALFVHYVERNRLAMLMKNAPWRLALWAPLHFCLVTASYGRRDVLAPLVRGHRPNTVLLRRRVRAFAAFVRMVPGLLRDRRALRRRQVVSDRELLSWMVPQP